MSTLIEGSSETAEAAEADSAPMHAVVKVKDKSGKTWKEVGEVISVSLTGAGFYMKRECKPGRLALVAIPVDPEMRSYDKEKELYRVWGLIQHCHKITTEDCGYHVGVAFIGREAPGSYREDPMQSYRICGMDQNGFWKVQAAEKEFTPRRDARFHAAVDHYLAVVDAGKTSVKGERTITENISKNGAGVITNLDLHVGDRVKFISEQYDFSGLAVVCDRRTGVDGKTRLSLQFVGSPFPVERLSAKQTTTVNAPNGGPVAV